MRTPPRIIPLNLPAGLESEIEGNPVTTRLESAIANCYPGLEVDIRNLDRRFFPGLVFEFVFMDDNDPQVASRGARLVGVDSSDPDIPAEMLEKVRALDALRRSATYFLQSLTAAGGERIELVDESGKPYDWDVTWRLVRSLPAGPVRIELSTRQGDPAVELEAPRRVFQNSSGELSSVYQAGELSQSLCSPWQHDFRDCACTYWASNHPDIVLPAHPMNLEEVHDPGENADRAEEPIIWMRWEQTADVAARPTRETCTPFEMDHYELNQRWRDLAVVLEGRESRAPWSIGPVENAAPLEPEKLLKELQKLAGIEHALALEYLYARYTVRFEDPTLPLDDQQRADFIAHELLVIAMSEMQHLRWVNQLIWELTDFLGSQHRPAPALAVADEVPEEAHGPGSKPGTVVYVQPKMRSLDQGIDHFIAAESLSGSVDGQYASLLARLAFGLPPGAKLNWDGELIPIAAHVDFPPDLSGLVERIISDGVTHYSRFREMKSLYLRSGDILRPLDSPSGYDYTEYKDLYRTLIRNLRLAYAAGRAEDRHYLIDARTAMEDLDRKATALASQQNIAIPLLDIARAQS